jgi:hypothetical protein
MIDWQGHTIWGAEIDLSLPVVNHTKAAAGPVWLMIQPADIFGPDLLMLTGKGRLEDATMIGPGIAFRGPVIAPGKSATLKAAVFYQASFRADYSVTVAIAPASPSASDLDAGTIGTWPGLWASISIC